MGRSPIRYPIALSPYFADFHLQDLKVDLVSTGWINVSRDLRFEISPRCMQKVYEATLPVQSTPGVQRRHTNQYHGCTGMYDYAYEIGSGPGNGRWEIKKRKNRTMLFKITDAFYIPGRKGCTIISEGPVKLPDDSKWNCMPLKIKGDGWEVSAKGCAERYMKFDRAIEDRPIAVWLMGTEIEKKLLIGAEVFWDGK